MPIKLLIKIITMFAFAIYAILLTQAGMAAPAFLNPQGKWIQIDEQTRQPHSLIQIYSVDGKLVGKVIAAYAQNGKAPRKYCDLCKGNLYNAPIVGLVIMQGFTQTKQNVWGNGTILDPSSGKTYNCKLTLSKDGNVLGVRGYVGISLLGRTQVWLRAKDSR